MSKPMFTRAVRFGLSLAAVASLALATGRNIAPDAVTRATTWNESSGDVAVLTDGLVPPDSSAQSYTWSSKGVLAFQWEGEVTLDRIRLRAGDVANDYQIRTYVGGHLQDEGATRDPEGVQTSRVEDLSRVIDGWQEVELPAGTRADNIEVRTLGPAEFYEIEILTSERTAVTRTGWASVKSAALTPF